MKDDFFLPSRRRAAHLKPDPFFVHHSELFLCERWHASVANELFPPSIVSGPDANGGIDAPLRCPSGMNVRKQVEGSAGRFGPPCVFGLESARASFSARDDHVRVTSR